MPLAINITDVELFDQLNIFRQDDLDDAGLPIAERWYVSLAGSYVNDKGKTLPLTRTRRLTAAQMTTIKNFLENQRTAIKTEDTITP